MQGTNRQEFPRFPRSGAPLDSILVARGSALRDVLTSLKKSSKQVGSEENRGALRSWAMGICSG